MAQHFQDFQSRGDSLSQEPTLKQSLAKESRVLALRDIGFRTGSLENGFMRSLKGFCEEFEKTRRPQSRTRNKRILNNTGTGTPNCEEPL